MTTRRRERAVGYRAGQRIDEARMSLSEIIRETRSLLRHPNTDERYQRLGIILDAAHEGLRQLDQIHQEVHDGAQC
jgi:hypothetical protein